MQSQWMLLTKRLSCKQMGQWTRERNVCTDKASSVISGTIQATFLSGHLGQEEARRVQSKGNY